MGNVIRHVNVHCLTSDSIGNFYDTYCIVGKFGGVEVWQIDSFQAFDERKFGELIDQPIDYLL